MTANGDASDCAAELRRIASMIDEGYTSGEVDGGSWTMSGQDRDDTEG